MARLLVLFGSGETTPAFVTLHRELFARHGTLGSADAVMLDTTYGFQTNADELTARLRGYFADSTGVDVGEVKLRSSTGSPGAVATAIDSVTSARWVFAGPGSPTYSARHWLATGMDRAFARVLERGSLVVASAAAMSLGSHVMPVYEIYRVGEEPHWKQGLDVIGSALGVKAAVVAHYDNVEGGTHDTRFCFAGAERFAALEAQLPPDTGVIGIDEHTAVVIDLDAGTIAVHGRGGLTLRSPGGVGELVVTAGSTLALPELQQVFVATDRPSVADGSATVGIGDVELLIDAHRYVDAVDAMLELDAQGVDHALLRPLLARMGKAAASDAAAHELVGQLLDVIIGLRESARAEKRWADADRVRDRLKALGIGINDGPGGAEWSRSALPH